MAYLCLLLWFLLEFLRIVLSALIVEIDSEPVDDSRLIKLVSMRVDASVAFVVMAAFKNRSQRFASFVLERRCDDALFFHAK